MLEVVGQHHGRSPESPGLSVEQLRQELPFDRVVLDAVVALLKRDGRLVEQNQRLALPGHRPTFREEESQHLAAIEAMFRQRAFSPPSVEELVKQTGVAQGTVEKLIKALREHERLVWVGEGLWFHREAVDRARQILVEHIGNKGRLESVEFKYLLDTTRKFAIPLLDYFDRVVPLRRVGNTRYLKTPPSM